MNKKYKEIYIMTDSGIFYTGAGFFMLEMAEEGSWILNIIMFLTTYTMFLVNIQWVDT